MRVPLLLSAIVPLACATPSKPVETTPGPATAAFGSAAAAHGSLVAALRDEYRALARIQAVLGWYESTQGESSLNALTYVGHDRLFSRAALDAITAELQRPGMAPNEQLALRFLRRSLAGETVGLAVAPFNDEYADAEAQATVTVPFVGQPIPYRNLTLQIAGEQDPSRRATLFTAGSLVMEQKLNPILERKEEAAQKAAREAGFADYVAMSEELRAVNLRELLASGVKYLAATDELFATQLDRVAREELGVPREKLRIADLTRLWKAPKLAQHFDKTLELEALSHFLSGIGLDMKTAVGGEVVVDDSLHPKKRPRAFVNPVDAPRDVRMSVKPTGGLDDYWTLFHEAGHAVHFAQATIEPKELVLLGHGAPTEAFGEFFRHAFSDPKWLVRYQAFLKAKGRPAPTAVELSAILRRTALVEMMYLRRYAFAKTAYELRLHGRPLSEIEPALGVLKDRAAVEKGDAASMRALYKGLFSASYGFELSDEEALRYRADVDDTFYSADYARSFALAGMMHEGVRKKFGDDWYANKDVGRFLREQLFAQGTALSPEDVAQRLGFDAKVDFELAARRAQKLVADADALEKAK